MQPESLSPPLSHQDFQTLVASGKSFQTSFEPSKVLFGRHLGLYQLCQLGYLVVPTVLSVFIAWRMQSWEYLLGITVPALTVLVGGVAKIAFRFNVLLIALVLLLIGVWIRSGLNSGQWVKLEYPSFLNCLLLLATWVQSLMSIAERVAMAGVKHRLLTDEKFFYAAQRAGHVLVHR